MAWKLPPDQDAMGGVLGGGQDMPLWLQSGTEQTPTAQQQRHWKLLDPFNMPRVRGIGEAIASALLPQRDEKGMPKAPGLGDFISSALMALPSGRGARPLPGRQMNTPERLVGSSVVLDGKVWTGPNHGMAVLNAEDQGVNTAAAFKTANRNGWWPGEPNTDGGFVTSHGRVVSRQEAADIMENSRQMTFDPGLEAARAQYKKNGVWSEDISGSLNAKRNNELAQQWNGRPLDDFATDRMAIPPSWWPTAERKMDNR